MSAFGGILATALTSLLPDSVGATARVAIAMLASEGVRAAAGALPDGGVAALFRPAGRKVTVHPDDAPDIYGRLEEHVCARFEASLGAASVRDSRGRMSTSLRGALASAPLRVRVGEHEVAVSIAHCGKDAAASSTRPGAPAIEVTSRTASIDEIKHAIGAMLRSDIASSSRDLTVYRVAVEKVGNNRRVEWEAVQCTTNKNFVNTVVAASVKRDLFDDVAAFADNEAEYVRRGLPYQRGYLLHGPPGTGKSSAIKAIANELRAPVFSLTLDDVYSEIDLNRLVTQMAAAARGQLHVVCIEDADRMGVFAGGYHNRTNLTVRAVMNFLDGVVETRGRVVVVTANTPEILTAHSALTRPGRIDKVVELGECEDAQAVALARLFHPTLAVADAGTLRQKATPAAFIAALLGVDTQAGVDELFDVSEVTASAAATASEAPAAKRAKAKPTPTQKAEEEVRRARAALRLSKTARRKLAANEKRLAAATRTLAKLKQDDRDARAAKRKADKANRRRGGAPFVL